MPREDSDAAADGKIAGRRAPQKVGVGPVGAGIYRRAGFQPVVRVLTHVDGIPSTSARAQRSVLSRNGDAALLLMYRVLKAKWELE
jgi:hypothetical protein